jgi:hypothetical protein
MVVQETFLPSSPSWRDTASSVLILADANAFVMTGRLIMVHKGDHRSQCDHRVSYFNDLASGFSAIFSASSVLSPETSDKPSDNGSR